MKRFGLILLRVFTAFDWPLLAILLMFAALGLTVMHSAVGGTDWRFADQSRNFVIAFFAMWIMALIPQVADEAGAAILCGGRGAAAGRGVLRRDQQGRDPLAQPGRDPHPAVRDDEDRRAHDAGLVFPAPRGRGAHPRLPGRGRHAGRAVRPDRAAARPGHGVAGVRRWLLRDLFRRPVVQAADPGLAGRHHRHRHPDLLRRPAVRAGRELGGAARLPEAPCLHAAQSSSDPLGRASTPSSP